MSVIRVGVRGVVVQERHILMVQYEDNYGIHYNLPGGGVEFGETLHEALKREVLEETALDIEVGELLFVYEHVQIADYLSHPHTLSIFFRCQPIDGSEARLPDNPDPDEVDVVWMDLAAFKTSLLYPHVNEQVLAALDGDLTRFIETIAIDPPDTSV